MAIPASVFASVAGIKNFKAQAVNYCSNKLDKSVDSETY